VVAGKTLRNLWVRSTDQLTFWERTGINGNDRGRQFGSFAKGVSMRTENPNPLRNEAQLNCVALRSQLDCEVTGGAVKGQDERQLRAPLTAPPVTPGSILHGRELTLGRLNTRKTDKSGGAVGRASCQSSLLSDPNAKFSAQMWRKPQRTRSKEGRHVGLDFYDLLIEGDYAHRESPRPSAEVKTRNRDFIDSYSAMPWIDLLSGTAIRSFDSPE
jgi:hypothetical protein